MKRASWKVPTTSILRSFGGISMRNDPSSSKHVLFWQRKCFLFFASRGREKCVFAAKNGRGVGTLARFVESSMCTLFSEFWVRAFELRCIMVVLLRCGRSLIWSPHYGVLVWSPNNMESIHIHMDVFRALACLPKLLIGLKIRNLNLIT